MNFKHWFNEQHARRVFMKKMTYFLFLALAFFSVYGHASTCFKIIASNEELSHSLFEMEAYTSVDRLHQLRTMLIEKAKRGAIPANYAKLRIEEQMAINLYTGEMYKSINKQLWNEALDDVNYFKSLCSALNQLPVFIGTTYRKTNIPNDELALYKTGKIVSFKGFTSSSTDLAQTMPFRGNVTFIIHSTSGIDIQPLARLSSEREILFRAGSVFRVKEIKQLGHQDTLLVLEDNNL